MKKIYEAPKMLVEVVCVDEMLASSEISIMGDERKVTESDLENLLTKDREDSAWGGLW